MIHTSKACSHSPFPSATLPQKLRSADGKHAPRPILPTSKGLLLPTNSSSRPMTGRPLFPSSKGAQSSDRGNPLRPGTAPFHRVGGAASRCARFVGPMCGAWQRDPACLGVGVLPHFLTTLAPNSLTFKVMYPPFPSPAVLWQAARRLERTGALPEGRGRRQSGTEGVGASRSAPNRRRRCSISNSSSRRRRSSSSSRRRRHSSVWAWGAVAATCCA